MENKEELLCKQLSRLDNVKREFITGAVRDSNNNKPFIHNLQGYTRQRFGYHTNLGARNYGDGNFLKGIPTPVALESLDRHLASYMDGDRSEDHLSAIIFGVQLCMLNEKKEGMNADYYFNLKQTNESTNKETRGNL